MNIYWIVSSKISKAKAIVVTPFVYNMRKLHMLRLYPDYKNINSIDIDSEEKSEKNNESTPTIKYRNP
jgi:hypothetical protein